MLKLVKPLVIKFIDKVLNYTATNIPLQIQMQALAETAKYVEEEMMSATTFSNNFSLLKFALSKTQLDGLFMEFGVWSGTTINFIANNVQKTVHGFDSFEGLPEFWTEGIIIGRYEKGTFNTNGKLPSVRENVKLHVGWFDKSLPEFISSNQENISFMHIDCDLYSSTKTIFDTLGERIKPGTIIVFDEYFNYPGWKKHEFKAFQEFIIKSNKKYEYIGYNKFGREVAIMMI